jgi:hypothetical protein
LRNISKNKKASILDIIYIAVIIFSLAIAGVFVKLITDRFHATIPAQLNATGGNAAEASGIVGAVFSGFSGMIDWITFAIFIGMLIALVITSFMFDTHPVYFFIFLILSIIIFLLSAIFSNVYQTMNADPNLSPTIASMPKQTFIMNYYPYVLLICIAISVIIIYGKSRVSRGQF